MYTHSHYVPIVRWKRAEKVALRDLFPTTKSKITPLIEIPEDRTADSKDADSIALAWGSSPFFFDFGAQSQSISRELVQSFFVNARIRGLNPIPTACLGSSDTFKESVAEVAGEDGRGICLRLFREDLARPNLPELLTNLLAKLEQLEGSVDLMIDLKIFRNEDVLIGKMLEAIPKISEWRTLTLAAGSFPKDLRDFPVGEHEQPRSEWVSWLTAITKHSLTRKPTFADYTIIHPYLTTPIPGMNISASIRYTAWDYWVIMRGEGLKNKDGAKYAQYPANAESLTEREEFCGAFFSAGDRYISDIANKKEPTGSPETWLRAGINHHITYVVDQLAKTFGKS